MAFSTFVLNVRERDFGSTKPTFVHVKVYPLATVSGALLTAVKDTTGNVVLSGHADIKADASQITAGLVAITLPDPRDTTLNPTGFGLRVDVRTNYFSRSVIFGPTEIGLYISGGVLELEDVSSVDPAAFTSAASYAAQGDLNAEVTRATAAEATKVNTSTYTSGQATQDAALTAETTRATAAESTVQTAAANDATSKVATETARANAAETALQNLTNSTFTTALNNAYATRTHGAAPAGAVCFTWDDGFASHYTQVKPYAEALGQKHTFCVVPGFFGTAGYMTSAQVLSLFQAGHEIANHSQTHADMSIASAAQRLIEMDTSQANLDAIIGPGNVTSWCYPYGNRNATTFSEIHLRYKRQLLTTSGWSGRLTPLTPNRKTMRTVSRFSLNGTAQAQTRALELIRRASVEPIIVTLYGHDIGASGSPTLAQAQALMDYANTLKVPCIRLDQAFPSEPLLLDGGFEDAGMTWWDINRSDANQIAESIVDTPATNLNGSRSLHLQCNADTGTFVYVTQQVPLVPGLKYTFGGRLRTSYTSGAGGLQFRVRQNDALGTQIAAAAWTLTGSGWTQFNSSSTTFTADLGVATGFVDVLLQNVTGQAWIDHLDLAPTFEGNFG